MEVKSNTDSTFFDITNPAVRVKDVQFIENIVVEQEQCVLGSEIDISWIGDQKVNCYLSYGNNTDNIFLGKVDKSVGYSPLYEFISTIPYSGMPSGDQYQVIIESKDNPDLKLTSNKFSVKEPPFNIFGEWEVTKDFTGPFLLDEWIFLITNDGNTYEPRELTLFCWRK